MSNAMTVEARWIPSSATIHGVRLQIPVREPQRDNFNNSATYCHALIQFLGQDEFISRYGGRNLGNSFSRCVRQNRASDAG